MVVCNTNGPCHHGHAQRQHACTPAPARQPGSTESRTRSLAVIPWCSVFVSIEIARTMHQHMSAGNSTRHACTHTHTHTDSRAASDIWPRLVQCSPFFSISRTTPPPTAPPATPTSRPPTSSSSPPAPTRLPVTPTSRPPPPTPSRSTSKSWVCARSEIYLGGGGDSARINAAVASAINGSIIADFKKQKIKKNLSSACAKMGGSTPPGLSPLSSSFLRVESSLDPFWSSIVKRPSGGHEDRI